MNRPQGQRETGIHGTSQMSGEQGDVEPHNRRPADIRADSTWQSDRQSQLEWVVMPGASVSAVGESVATRITSRTLLARVSTT